MDSPCPATQSFPPYEDFWDAQWEFSATRCSSMDQGTPHPPHIIFCVNLLYLPQWILVNIWVEVWVVVRSMWGLVVPSWPVGKGLLISVRLLQTFYHILYFWGLGLPKMLGFCRVPGARLKITFECYQVKVGDCTDPSLGQLARGFLLLPVWKDFWVRSTFLRASQFGQMAQTLPPLHESIFGQDDTGFSFCCHVSRHNHLSFWNITVKKSIFGCNSSQLCGW